MVLRQTFCVPERVAPPRWVPHFELLSSASCAAATSALSRTWGSNEREQGTKSSEQLAVRSVFDEGAAA